MPEVKGADLSAIQFRRGRDGGWYAVGTFRDKESGKSRRCMMRQDIQQHVIDQIVCVAETGEPVRRDPKTGKILIKIDPDIDDGSTLWPIES